jgi:hypothetical protein
VVIFTHNLKLTIMRKVKFAMAALAAISGIGGAYLTQVKAANTKAPNAVHAWRTALSITTRFTGTTTAASALCPGTTTTCLIAKDNPALKAFGTKP